MENRFSAYNGSFSSRIFLSNGLQHGDYSIGPKINFCNHPVNDITECIAKNEDSGEFVVLKILHCNLGEELDNSQGKVLLHNEHLILSLLQDKPGVIHHHGLFKFCDKFILVLDCLFSHGFDNKGGYKDYNNLQQYVIQKKRLEGIESLEIFCSIIITLKTLHQNNIVHRDLKLGNMVYNKRKKIVKIINFGLSKHLIRKDELLTDQCGSLAYVSPEILSGNAYDGKASDMWAMGVILYTMMYGQFPFYDSNRHQLFQKIHSAELTIPSSSLEEYHQLIKMLLQKDPNKRLTAVQTLDLAQQYVSQILDPKQAFDTQVVPTSGREENVRTDCVVPISTLNQDVNSSENLELHAQIVNSELPFEPCALQSSLNRALTITSQSRNHPDTCTMLQISESPFFKFPITTTSRHSNSTDNIDSISREARIRRNSSGSESRTRRHSAAPQYRTSCIRHRRRSHDVRDEQCDLLERLHVASRRRSLSSPFHISQTSCSRP